MRYIMDDIFVFIVGLLLFIAFSIVMSFLYWLCGFILYQFKFSKTAGFKLMCMSGLFPKLLPKYCPCSSCYGTSCGMWTCPLYSEDNKKYTGLP